MVSEEGKTPVIESSLSEHLKVLEKSEKVKIQDDHEIGVNKGRSVRESG